MKRVIFLTPMLSGAVALTPLDSEMMPVREAAKVFANALEDRPFQKFALILDADVNALEAHAIHAKAPLCFHATTVETFMAFWKAIEEQDGAKDRIILSLSMADGLGTTALAKLKAALLGSDIDHVPTQIRSHSEDTAHSAAFTQELEHLQGVSERCS